MMHGPLNVKSILITSSRQRAGHLFRFVPLSIPINILV